jgi:hypothetical protein
MAKPLHFPVRPENADAATVLRLLGGLRPAREWQSGPSALCRVVEGWATALLLSSGALFVLVCVLTLAQAVSPLSGQWHPGMGVSTVLGSGAQWGALAALLLQALAGAGHLWLSSWRSGPLRQKRLEHDFAQARRLGHFEASALAGADRWIEQEVRRLESRRIFVIGGAEKLILAALLGAGWAVWNALVGESLPTAGAPLVYGLALLACVIAGGLSMRRTIARLTYQRDLIALAGLAMPSGGACASEATRPSSGREG